MKQYVDSLGDPHNTLSVVSTLDVTLRNIMGRDTDETVGICSHQMILKREMEKDGKNLEDYCRKCGLPLVDGVARVNDYLVIRNKDCPSAICMDCVKAGGDIFYINFANALETLKKKKNENYR